MNGQIAELIALACHGNAFLSGRPIGDLFNSNSAFQYCNQVSFSVAQKKLLGREKRKEIAGSPNEWLGYLKSTGTSSIQLCHSPSYNHELPDRISSAFVSGGGTWTLETKNSEDQFIYWNYESVVGNKGAENRRIWDICYFGICGDKLFTVDTLNLKKIREELKRVLIEAQQFSKSVDQTWFAKNFSNALDVLNGETRELYHPDLFPSDYLPNDAETLINAGQLAWVFGGMGSWNDIWFEDQTKNKDYETLSEELYRLVTLSFLTSVNLSINEWQ